MRIGGLVKFTANDYPGHLAAVIFLQGCSFTCGYCHNVELVKANMMGTPIELFEILKFLDKRKEGLEGVVISGGEPTIYQDLPLLIRLIRSFGLKIKLDTNGANPDALEGLIEEGLIDYIAMDIKASPERYLEITGRDSIKDVERSIRMIMDSGIDYEFRSTLIKEVHPIEEIKKMAEMIRGADRYILQEFRPFKTASEEYKNLTTYIREEFKLYILPELEKLVKELKFRGR